MHSASSRLALAVAILCALGSDAFAQRAELRVDRQAYAGLPFVANVVVEGFDEQPAPELPELSVDGAEVTPLGANPNVQTSVRIINGRRTRSRRVTWVLRYRIDADKPGTYRIPPVAVEQGSKRVRTNPATVRVEEIPPSPDMAIELVLPDRKVWVGETVPVHVDWYLRREVDDQTFSVPLFDREDDVRVAPPSGGKRALTFRAGSGEVDLPLEQTRVRRGGAEFVRIRFTALVTPTTPGRLELEPARVVAKLETGVTRDRMGFPTRRYGLFQAVDQQRVLEVAPLPLAGRPPSFSGAVGSSFSISTSASRSVVKLGEPVELTIQVRGDTRLEGLTLPPLGTPAILDPQEFTVPEETPVGELDNPEGTSKTFDVTVQVKDPSVRKIPEIPFSFFDPEAGEYRTVSSEAIAMQVEGAAIVSADDVVSAQGDNRTGPATGALSVRNADLGLSAPGDTLRTVLSVADLRPLLFLLYLLPLGLLVGRIVWLRRRASRETSAEARSAASELGRAIDAAARQPAREAAGPLVAAVKSLARATGRAPSDAAALIEEIETAGYAPSAADDPLPSELRDRVRTLEGEWRSAPPKTASASAIAILPLVLIAGASATAGQTHDLLAQARAAYDEGMAASDRAQRTASFARAAELLATVAETHPDRPELLADRGNAALGAGKRGDAVLAYRRAILLDPGLERARANLAFARGQLPSAIPKPDEAGALDTLFFWHRSMSLAHRHLWGALAFAIAILLVTPWSRNARRRRLLRRVAVLPTAVWLAMVGSALFEPDRSSDAVVIADGEQLRSADSPGAPAAMSTPLPAGVEVTIGEERGGWRRVSLADGTRGWLPSSAVERVIASNHR